MPHFSGNLGWLVVGKRHKMANKRKYIQRNIDVYIRHVNMWHFTIIIGRENLFSIGYI